MKARWLEPLVSGKPEQSQRSMAPHVKGAVITQPGPAFSGGNWQSARRAFQLSWKIRIFIWNLIWRCWDRPKTDLQIESSSWNTTSLPEEPLAVQMAFPRCESGHDGSNDSPWWSPFATSSVVIHKGSLPLCLRGRGLLWLALQSGKERMKLLLSAYWAPRAAGWRVISRPGESGASYVQGCHQQCRLCSRTRGPTLSSTLPLSHVRS